MHYWNYNEKKQHGTADFPVEFYHITDCHPRYVMPFHWHLESEIIMILEGSFDFTLDNENITAHPGDLLFIQDGIIHGGTPENCVYECLVFNMNTLLMHTDACRKYMRRVLHHELLVKPYFPYANDALHERARKLFFLMKEDYPGRELSILGYLYELFGIIFKEELYTKSQDSQPGSPKKMLPLKAALEWIEAHYSETITLYDLARTAGMSPTYFCRYFQALTHQTPFEYLNCYRVERACHQITTTELSSTEIAYNCGFNDSSYFIRIFKKYKGMTPRQYARSMQG